MTTVKFVYIFVLISLLYSMVQVTEGTKRFYTNTRMHKLREQVRDMFQHAYEGYLQVAEYDELRPLTCDGVDTWGSYSLTLIDALDTLATMGNFSEFRRVANLLETKMNFDKDINVSVFETNIRVVGGLISAHLLSRRAGIATEGWPCHGPLLRLAEDVAQRLLPAFDTATGMPYGTVNLRRGVPKDETSVTCTAGVGTFLVEFGTLSRLTGNPIYEQVALNAVYALWERRSPKGLFGNHIDVQTGRWTATDAGIGAGVDSFFEYLVKGAILLNRPELMDMFHEARDAIDKYLKRDDWYVWANMHKGTVTLPVFQSLEAFWPGLLSLIGENAAAVRTLARYSSVWRKYGFLPEFYNIPNGEASANRESYPLRPELAESLMYLYRSTKNQLMLELGELMVDTIEFSAKTKCGYATIRNVVTHEKENRMESFFLAETTKYLYLLFDEQNFLHNDGSSGKRWQTEYGECAVDAGAYIFNTEAHPVDMSALYCCHGLQEDPYEDLDLDAFRDDVLLKAEQQKRELTEKFHEKTHCADAVNENPRPPNKPRIIKEGETNTLAVDIEVFDEDDNPAGEILVENFQRIRNERSLLAADVAGTAETKRNQLTVTDLDEFFGMSNQYFEGNANAILSYVMTFMHNFTLDAAFISGLNVLDKNLTVVLGAVIQKEFEGRIRTLWELYELQAQYIINAELVTELGLLAFDEENTALLEHLTTALNESDNGTLAITAEPPVSDILHKLNASRYKFEMSLVNTTAMQEFLLKILQNGTQEKKRNYIALLDDKEIAKLYRRSYRKNIFANVQRVVELKKRMIETFDRLQALMDESNKLASATGNETATVTPHENTTSGVQNESSPMPETSTTKASNLENDTKQYAKPTSNNNTNVAAKEAKSNDSVWSQLVQTILRKTNLQSTKFDEQLLQQKTQDSLQRYATQKAEALNKYELFTCPSSRFIERFAYRDFYP